MMDPARFDIWVVAGVLLIIGLAIAGSLLP